MLSVVASKGSSVEHQHLLTMNHQLKFQLSHLKMSLANSNPPVLETSQVCGRGRSRGDAREDPAFVERDLIRGTYKSWRL